MASEDKPGIGVSQFRPRIDWDPTRPQFADVNHWHPLIDSGAYARASKPGCIGIKIAENGLAARLGANMVQTCEAQGLIVIGYQYGCMHPEQYCELFPPKPGRIPCLDFEGTTANLTNATKWINVVSAKWQRLPWFYCGIKWDEIGSPSESVAVSCPWWGAQYGSHLNLRRGLGSPVAWQFGDRGSHPGVGPNCDLNALLCSIGELRTMAGLPPLPEGPRDGA